MSTRYNAQRFSARRCEQNATAHQWGWRQSWELMRRAHIKVNVSGIMDRPDSKADARDARKSPADAQHAASRHNALTTSRTSTGARRSPIAAGCSHHFPATKARAESPRLTASFAGQTNPENGLPTSRTAQTPLPELTQASQHHSRSQHGHSRGTEQKEAHLVFSRRRSSGQARNLRNFTRKSS